MTFKSSSLGIQRLIIKSRSRANIIQPLNTSPAYSSSRSEKEI